VTADDAGRERSDSSAADETAPHPAQASLWEVFLSRDSLVRALRGVEQDAGAAGVDGMTTGGVGRWLEEQWSSVRSRLDAGAYRPRPVGRVTIAKPWGGERLVGVPRALDRLIEQALLQVLTPVFDSCFDDGSFGVRPGRSADRAVAAARQSIQDGAASAVEVDLDAFFDRVEHDALMARVARRVDDRRVLRLIRRSLEAGVLADGIEQGSEQGTRQGLAAVAAACERDAGRPRPGAGQARASFRGVTPTS
jgi:RNA-directed DNA polymerase